MFFYWNPIWYIVTTFIHRGKTYMKEPKERSAVKEHTMIFLGMAAGIVGIAILMVLMAFCFMLGHAAINWLWKALGN